MVSARRRNVLGRRRTRRRGEPAAGSVVMLANRQVGPDHALDALSGVVDEVAYKPGWRVWLEDMARPTEHLAGSEGLTLCIAADLPDSTKPGAMTLAAHWMAVPPTSWRRDAWIRWVFDQLLLVETHEAMEFYSVAGHKVFFPSHGPGRNPYEVKWRSDEAA